MPCDNTHTNNVGLFDELLIEILIKLPLKCIYRYKCVSRSWRRLIADRYVAARLPLIVSSVFYRFSPSDLKHKPRYGCNSNGYFHESDLSSLPFYLNSTIIDCCNGLLLFYCSLPSSFHVCNPTIKTWVALPNPRCKSQLSILAFDAYKSPYFNVVCFSGWEENGGQLEVFSSETGRWVEHSLKWEVETNKLSASIHYFNGVLHVLAHPRHVACIDLETMLCSVIELPEDMNNDVCLGHSSGFLHFVANDGNELRIWVLRGLKWQLKSRISVAEIKEWNGMVSNAVLYHRQLKFMAFHPLEEKVFLWVMGKLVSYDLCKKRFGLVCDLGADDEKAQFIQIWLFPFLDCVSQCLR